MTAKRLNVQGQGASAPQALRGVAPPVRTAGRSHGLAQVLEIMLAVAGLPLDYDAVMGLSGLAFRTPPWPDEPELSRDEAIAASENLGLALTGGITVTAEAADLPPEQVIARVAESVNAGRACAAFGWGSIKDEWSIICGFDHARGRLLGHCLLDKPREQYESWSPNLDVLITLPAPAKPSGREAIARALRRGSNRVLEEAPGRYRDWARELRETDASPSAMHEDAVELLADARSSATAFAESVALHESEVTATWLIEAGNLWRGIAEILDTRGAPHTREAVAWLDHQEGRDAWAAMLERAADLDDRAAVAVKCSSDADYLPEEAYRT